MRKYKPKREKKAGERLSFYIALSVCIMAVGMAIWSAYMTFTEPSEDKEGGYFASMSKDEAAVNEDMTGVYEKETKPAAASSTVPATERPAAPAKTEPKAQEETKPEPVRGFTVTETLPEQRERAVIGGEVSPLQAVLQVNESLSYPVKSRKVLKPYSEESVYNKTMHDLRGHTGCDFAAGEGETIYAMCGGTVKDISVSELYGVIIEVECNGFSVYYCGLSNEFAVSEGDTLKTGDTVGTLSKIPCESADEPHLHVEIRVGDKLIDPLSVIDSES